MPSPASRGGRPQASQRGAKPEECPPPEVVGTSTASNMARQVVLVSPATAWSRLRVPPTQARGGHRDDAFGEGGTVSTRHRVMAGACVNIQSQSSSNSCGRRLVIWRASRVRAGLGQVRGASTRTVVAFGAVCSFTFSSMASSCASLTCSQLRGGRLSPELRWAHRSVALTAPAPQSGPAAPCSAPCSPPL